MKEIFMVKEIVLMNIDVELKRAKKAGEEGNIGMARVCVRRACGISISFWLENNPRQGYGESAMNQLRSVQSDDTVPKEVKDAAERLTTHVANQSDLKFTTDPIADAKILTNYFLNVKS
jgi:hypothetical protein